LYDAILRLLLDDFMLRFLPLGAEQLPYFTLGFHWPEPDPLSFIEHELIHGRMEQAYSSAVLQGTESRVSNG
jgi:hypothetical protein